jgi:type IVB pilus formation R64 PilN family outer membrane protein
MRASGALARWPSGRSPHGRNLRWLVLVGVFGALSGCALADRVRQAAAQHRDATQTVTRGHQEFSGAITDPELRRAAQQVDKPWIAGRAQPLARELSLPPALRANVQTTLLFADGTDDLRRIARRIAAVTGIPVRVQPDALLPDSQFLPRLAGQTGHGQQASSEIEQPFELAPGPAPLPQILDRLAAYRGVRWRHGPDGIEFFRTETRVFNVQALTLDARAQASLGLGRNQTEGGFVSASSTRLSGSDQDVMKSIRARIEPFLSRSGVLVAEPGASSSVVVTDTPDVLARIGRYLEQENRALTRRVRLVFEELTVALSEQAHASLDWNLVFSGARLAAGLAVPAVATGPAGRLAVGVTRGPMSGSEAVIQALGESVRLVRRSSVPMLTLSRRPVTHAVRTTFSYIDRVETTPVVGATGLAVPAVSVNQKEETVGSLLTLVPDAQEDGQILLSLAYDNTVAQPLKTVTFGDKSNPLQLQQLTVEGNGTVQQLALQPGQPLVVSGFERRQSESTERRLNPGLPAILGGGNALNEQRLATILIITAQVEEGP